MGAPRGNQGVCPPGALGAHPPRRAPGLGDPGQGKQLPGPSPEQRTGVWEGAWTGVSPLHAPSLPTLAEGSCKWTGGTQAREGTLLTFSRSHTLLGRVGDPVPSPNPHPATPGLLQPVSQISRLWALPQS